MKIDIVIYPSLHGDAQLTRDISQLTIAIDTRERNLPNGWRMLRTGPMSYRKFIVLKGTGKLVLVIGPIIIEKEYLHAAIYSIAKPHFPDHKISGGGLVVLEGVDGMPPRWSAAFSGRSSEYGLFDQQLVIEAKQLLQVMSPFQITIDWHASADDIRQLPDSE